MDRRPNTFELFGADFMICENYYPWLIEINSSPDLGNTTSVTARMCPQCLEDTIKGMIDMLFLSTFIHIFLLQWLSTGKTMPKRTLVGLS